MIKMLIIVGCIFGLIFLFDIVRDILMKRFFAHFALPTVTISTSIAKAEDWTPTISAVGTLVATSGVEVSPQVAGMVTAINFQSGQMVKQGDPLVQLDDRTDQQDLKNFNAQLTLAQVEYQRQVNLAKTNSTSKSSIDQAAATLQEAQAAVAKTQILIDQKLIKAPFSGKLGIRNVNIGQYVSPGTGLVNLQTMDPLLIQFSLPEQNLKYLYPGQLIDFSVDTYPEQKFRGQITATEASVNTQTRNILVEATVPNKDMRLYPGLFANIEVLLPTKQNLVTVPQTAVSYSLFGDSVFVVKQEGKDADGKPNLVVHLRYVTTGDRRGNEVAIIKNLKAGEEVVNSGQLKLDDGVKVQVNNSVQLPGLSPSELKQNRS
ncbi:MAG TPA: efflux RND transporter periplasmic adaptor subunit [Gammaproteobacteria bacterium]|nr:efflux RND transporter periplasmic adaptor subunit [Gammaproteobacteria bacterium]